jgi:hypothetical protein
MTAGFPATSPQRGWSRWSGLDAPASTLAVAALVAGVVLRWWGLAAQILGGDELHALRAALSLRMPAILTTYQLADSCIPLTALDRLLLDHGVALDEAWVRLPVLASGLAALVAIPALARRHLEPAARPLLWALVAVSPLLVLYSRIARPYMPATLLSFAAVMAFAAWWLPESDLLTSESKPAGRRRGAALAAGAYVVLGALALWFHLGAVPLVVAPLLFAGCELGLDAARRRGLDPSPRHSGRGLEPSPRHRGWRGLLATAAGLAGACALFLVPAAPSLARLVAAKRQAQSVPAAVWGGVLRLQAGTGQWVPALLFWAAAVVGAATLVRRRPRLGAYLLVLAMAQPLGILVLSPLGLTRVQVLDRYLLPALPLLLVWAAAGLARPWWPRQQALGRRGQRAAAAGLVLVWVTAGPFAGADFRASSFMHHNDLVAFALPHAVAPPDELPRPYLALGGPPGSAVVELPWPPVWDFGRAFYAYQAVHGLRVLVAPPGGALSPGRLRLRNWTSGDPAALLAGGARYVAVHRDLPAEEDRLLLPSGPPAPRRMPPAVAAGLRAAGEAAAARLTAAWGPPALSGGGVLVWDLARLRRTPGHGAYGMIAAQPGDRR